MTDHAQQHRFATASEVAEYLRISRKTFKRHVEPHLRGIDIGTRTIYDWEEVEGWLEANKGGPSTGHPTGHTTSGSDTRGLGTRSQRESATVTRLKSRLHGSTKKR